MRTFVSRLLGAIVFMLSMPALATLDIAMDGACPLGVSDSSPQPNCPPQAACRSRGNTVHWRRDDGGNFSLNFYGAESQIFENWGQGNCQSNSNSGGQLVCKIAADAQANDYKYDVEAEGCVLDPRLIIR